MALQVNRINQSIPNFHCSLESLKSKSEKGRIFAKTVVRKANILKVKKDSKKNMDLNKKAQAMQQSPKISHVSKLLIRMKSVPELPKYKYIKKLKDQIEKMKKKTKKYKNIDYSLIKSVSAFAIYSNDSMSSRVLPETPKKLPRKGIYAKGKSFLHLKAEKIDYKKAKFTEDSLKSYTFTPDQSKKSLKSRKKAAKKDFLQLSLCRSLSPYTPKLMNSLFPKNSHIKSLAVSPSLK